MTRIWFAVIIILYMYYRAWVYLYRQVVWRKNRWPCWTCTPGKVAVKSRSGWSGRCLGSKAQSDTRRLGTTEKTGNSVVSPVYRVQSLVTLCSAKCGALAVWARPAVVRPPQDCTRRPAADPGPVAPAVDCLLQILWYELTKQINLPAHTNTLILIKICSPKKETSYIFTCVYGMFTFRNRWHEINILNYLELESRFSVKRVLIKIHILGNVQTVNPSSA